ncbi:MAG: hypothetical protein GXP54_10360 [Deltaproteobacteria bacterium]|nr:hypothetical protein [Deltaproteobacteria bacterium]
MDRKTKIETTAKSIVLTKADVRNAIRNGELTDEEERYTRMRFGISEPPEAPLPRRGTRFPETRAKLAFIEASMAADLVPTASNPVKERIIERLREL